MPTRPRAKPSKPLQRESRRPSPQSTEEDNADLDAAYQSAVKFEQDNQDAIDKTGSRLASSDSVKELEGKVRDFATSSQVMMKVLDEIRGIHPFIDVVVIAFKAVVMLDRKRQDNDQKVLVLKAKMLDMMQVFIQLQMITPDHEAPTRAYSIEETLKGLCIKIAGDIKSSGNFCDFYSKKRTIVKLLQSPIYEDRLAKYTVTFEERGKELNTKLSLFTAQKIQVTAHQVEDVYMLTKIIFQRLSTPRERELWKVIEAGGGIEKCAKSESTLNELLKLDIQVETSGKPHTSKTSSNVNARSSLYSYSYAGHAPTQSYAYREEASSMFARSSNFEDAYSGSRFKYGDKPSGNLPARDSIEPSQHVINDLKEELRVNVDDDLKRNMPFFRRKFNEQRRQLQHLENTVIRHGDRVMKAVREGFQGPHERIGDLELRGIWKEMGWKLGVRVEKFVLTLHDYYVAQNNDSSMLDDEFRKQSWTTTSAEERTIVLSKAFSDAKKRGAERWALKHLSIRNIAPLIEVFDGDASGYVSIWEANQVTSLRPQGWSFLEWLAYWAAGRHYTIWHYRQKIGAIVLYMHKSLDSLLPTNRAIVDRYLMSLVTVDQILCDVLPCVEPLDDVLAAKVAAYIHAEEEIMEQKLQALDYEIDGPDTLGLIIGESQIERNLLPLIYLLLKHHLVVICSGYRSVFDREELSPASEALYQIFDAVHARVQTLDWLFGSQSHSGFKRTPDRFQVDAFAFGMYSALFRRSSPYHTKSLNYNPAELDLPGNPPQQLKYPSPDIVDALDTYPFKLQDYITGHIEGFWTGHLFDESHIPIHGMFEFEITSWDSENGGFQANGSYSQGVITIDGKVQRTMEAVLKGRPDYRKDPKLDVFLRGIVNRLSFTDVDLIFTKLPNQYTMSGEWGYVSESPQIRGVYHFRQTPAWVYQYKHVISTKSPSGTRAQSLWKFARSAILHQIYLQKSLLRSEFVQYALSELRQGAELSRYRYLLLDTERLNSKGQEDLNRLLLVSVPWKSRFYRSIARSRYRLNWATLHHDCRCFTCDTVILGSRYYCYSCYKDGSERNFCFDCHFKHDKAPTTGHSLIKTRGFNHRRDTDPLLQRIDALCPRPIYASFTYSESMSDSSSDFEGSSNMKQVHFKPQSSTPPDIDTLNNLLETPPATASFSPPSLSNSFNNPDEIEPNVDPEEVLSKSMQRCGECGEVVDLLADIFWSCMICSNLMTDKRVVICCECEHKNQSPYTKSHEGPAGMHNLDHPILRVYDGPRRYAAYGPGPVPRQTVFVPTQPPIIIARSRSSSGSPVRGRRRSRSRSRSPIGSRRGRTRSRESTDWSRHDRYSPRPIAPSEPPVIILQPSGTDPYPTPYPAMEHYPVQPYYDTTIYQPSGTINPYPTPYPAMEYYPVHGQVQPSYNTTIYPPFTNGVVPGFQTVQPYNFSQPLRVGPVEESKLQKVVNKYIRLFRRKD